MKNLDIKENELDAFYSQRIESYKAQEAKIRKKFLVFRNNIMVAIGNTKEKINKNITEIDQIAEVMKDFKLVFQNLILKKKDFLIRQKADLDEKNRLEGENIKLQNEFRTLRAFKENTEIVSSLSERNVKFLSSLGLDKRNSLNDIIDGFSKIYDDMLNRINIVEKEMDEIIYFKENNKSVLDKRTRKMLDDFTEKLTLARKEMDECRNYLNRKNEEIKSIKREKVEYVNKLKITEKKSVELKAILDRIRYKYQTIEKELINKTKIISELQMKISKGIKTQFF